MVRASAKNHANVAIVTSPTSVRRRHRRRGAGRVHAAERQALAAEAFVHTATYDVAVASWMGNVRSTDTSGGTGFPAWVGGDVGQARRCCATARTRTSPPPSTQRATPVSRPRAGRAAARQGDVVQQLRRRRRRAARGVRHRRARRRDHQAREPVRHRRRAPTSASAPAGARVRPRVRVRRRDRGERTGEPRWPRAGGRDLHRGHRRPRVEPGAVEVFKPRRTSASCSAGGLSPRRPWTCGPSRVASCSRRRPGRRRVEAGGDGPPLDARLG